MWICVIVGSRSVSSAPTSSVTVASISSYRTGLPRSLDQLGCVPHFATYSGIASMTSWSRSRPR
jgi:hypothetical protein